MENRDLFKEAIADAKTIKETALANAKATLEESFAPFLREKLAAKLAEIDEQEVEEAKEKEVKEAEDKVEEGLPNIDPGVEPKSQLRTKPDMAQLEEEDIDEEMDLEELLAELEEDMSESEDIAESEDVTEAEDVKEDIYEAEEDEEEGEKEEESEESEGEEAEDDEEEIDLEDMSEEDLKKFIESVIEDMVSAGELEAGESFEDDVDVDVDADGGLDIEDDMETAVDENKDKTEMEEMKKELYELKEELHEVNLLNSKLLYVNKIFRGKNLTENQKVKVLGAFDKATTVAEVKLVFETLSESLTTKKAAIKENLGSASKPMGTAPKKPILEVNDQFSRWQKLAGIK